MGKVSKKRIKDSVWYSTWSYLAYNCYLEEVVWGVQSSVENYAMDSVWDSVERSVGNSVEFYLSTSLTIPINNHLNNNDILI